jgi:hypothetical protein
MRKYPPPPLPVRKLQNMTTAMSDVVGGEIWRK